MNYTATGHTHKGRVRDHNEDTLFIDNNNGIFLVIDGLGGMAAGEVAARMARESIKQYLYANPTGSVSERICAAIVGANNAIYEAAQANARYTGMGCVLTLAILERDRMLVGHVGDTRLYEIQPGYIEQLTRDQSVVGQMVASGQLSEGEAMHHPMRNQVLNTVGSFLQDEKNPDFVQILEIPVHEDHAWLLCSDGLSDMVPAGDILRMVEGYARQPEQAVRALINQANEAGGLDNITALLVAGAAFADAVWTVDDMDTREIQLPLPLDPNKKAEPPAVRPRFVHRMYIMGLAIAFLLMLAGWYSYQVNWISITPLPEPLAVGNEHVFSTIQDALDQAQPGDTVRVYPGIYPGPVMLRDGITLESIEPGQAIITPTDSHQTAIIAHDLVQAALTGFKIVGTASGGTFDVGLHIQDASVFVDDVSIMQTWQAGIHYAGRTGGLLQNSHIASNIGTGIQIDDFAKPVLRQTVILNNGYHPASPRPGILITGRALPQLDDNVIAQNAAEGIRIVEALNIPTLLARNSYSLAGHTNIGPAIQTFSASDSLQFGTNISRFKALPPVP